MDSGEELLWVMLMESTVRSGGYAEQQMLRNALMATLLAREEAEEEEDEEDDAGDDDESEEEEEEEEEDDEEAGSEEESEEESEQESEEEEDESDVEYVEKDDGFAWEQPPEGPAYEGLSAEDREWAKRMTNWARCFHGASIKWTMVGDEALGDEKRRGLEVTFVANVRAWDYKGDARTLQLRRLREAIDLVRLLALAKPTVLRAMIRRQEGYSASSVPQFSVSEDELNALARGVPVEIRVLLIDGGLKTLGMKQRLATFFTHKLRETVSTNADFVAAWADLVVLASKKVGLVECNRRLGAPVPTSVLIDPSQSRGTSERESEQFYVNLIKFVRTVHGIQQAQKTKLWALDGRHGHLHFDKIQLRLRSLYLTPRTCRLAKALMDSEIPVTCKRLSIDQRYTVPDRDLVQSFVKAVRSEEDVYVTTDLFLFTPRIDARDENETKVIRIVTDAMASVERAVCVDVSGLLRVYTSRRNRQAVWQGLFESVLSRDPPLQDLTFSGDAELEGGDAEIVRKCASHWRKTHPSKKLCLRKLHLMLPGSHLDAITALLAAFDDVELVRIQANSSDEMTSSQLVLSSLRFPSLRELSLKNVVVESMDVFDPSIRDERLPVKPVLEVLHLENVVVRDTDSLHRFIANLVPNSDHPNPLSAKLRRLILDQDNLTFSDGALFDKDMVAAMHAALVQNSTLEYVAFTVDRDDEMAKEYPAQFKDQIGRPVQASREKCRSEIAKARQWAFLSVVQDTTNTKVAPSALHLFDARVVKLIFELSAPHVCRQVRVEECENLDEDDDEEEEEEDEDEDEDED